VTGAQDFPREQLNKLGQYIRDQRTRSRLSLRQLAELANVSNPYLSQIERGMHEPSVRVLKAIAAALDLSADVLLAEAGLLERVGGGRPSTRSASDLGRGGGASNEPTSDVERAINADPFLASEQKAALIQVYRSYLSAGPASAPGPGPGPGPAMVDPMTAFLAPHLPLPSPPHHGRGGHGPFDTTPSD
jgi:transcriptional regulator with XRE-family HTH domain